MTRMIVASGNRHKISEFRGVLEPLGFDVVGLDRLSDVPVIEETAGTFVGNADLKALGIASAARAQGEPGETWVVADDSGICIDALGGQPGVTSARFAGPDATDADNNARLVAELTHLGLDRSPAHYRCVLSLVRVDARDPPRHFEGRWNVEMRTSSAGNGGFGYDPHAWLPDGRSVAMLNADEKAGSSHRGQALADLLAAVRSSSL